MLKYIKDKQLFIEVNEYSLSTKGVTRKCIIAITKIFNYVKQMASYSGLCYW